MESGFAFAATNSVFRALTALRSFFAARFASLNFCFAVRKLSLASLAVFFAASACFCAVTICESSFFLAARAAAEDLVVMGGSGSWWRGR